MMETIHGLSLMKEESRKRFILSIPLSSSDSLTLGYSERKY